MNDESTLVLETPDQVRNFVAAVRARLRDLPIDDQQDLTEGLEADLSELLADQGPEALRDPDRYARELRAAAGLPSEAAKAPARRPAGVAVGKFLDGVHDGWDRIVRALPGDAAGFLATLRPVWWLVRAWAGVSLAVMIFDYQQGTQFLSSLPHSRWPLGLALILVAGCASLMFGRWWVKRSHSAAARVLLIAVNAAAVLLLVQSTSVMADSQPERTVVVNPSDQLNGGLMNANGEIVTNILPYDAQGNPLIGIQLFDQQGFPIEIKSTSTYDENTGLDRDLVPWFGRDGETRNVFPLGIERAGKLPTIPRDPDLAPGKVQMVGVTPSVVADQKAKPVKKR